MKSHTVSTSARVSPELLASIPAWPIPEVYHALDTQPQGLAQTEAEQRLATYGRNVIRKVKGKPLWLKFVVNFTHLMAILLWIGGFIALAARLPELAFAIWLVNLINGLFSFWQEYRAERATEALRKLMPAYARVVRDGQEQRLLAEELVPGDQIVLAEGDHISADARLVREAELRVDQSTLTGESHPVRKTSEAVLGRDLARIELPNLIFAGTSVAAGSARAVVLATGMDSEFGKIAGLTQSVGQDISPLQREMSTVTKMVSIIAICSGLVFFGLSLTLAGMSVAEGFIFALGMIVAFVPEGLLPTVTLALAMGVQRMAKRHALVKRLSAVETLGCTTIICTDKTGTLTQNEMTVSALWLAGQRLTVTGIGYEPQGQILSDGQPLQPNQTDEVRRLLIAASLCNNARILPPNDQISRWTVLGDPTEAALRVAALKGGVDPEAELIDLPRLRELPFESRRKRMSTIHRAGADRIAFIKGAPQEILNLCSRIRQAGGEACLTDALKCQITTANDAFARAGLRVLAVASRQLPSELTDLSVETVEQELTFLGLMAMMDPPRPEVTQAVNKCRQAGIRIIMITGDYGLTAESIARRIGIIHDAGDRPRIITGVELDALDDQALQTALAGSVIFARVAPEHKLRVVRNLQAMGHIVAVTGDGVNDAPALKKADIGVAMGLTGTDVSKEAADIILTDDNFASIVNAVEEGRAVYANIKKFTSYIFTSNTPEAVPFILFAFSRARIPLALNVMHILAVDLCTDMAPALALGAEKPEPGIMDRPPRPIKEHVITRSLLIRAYAWLGPVQALATMAAFYYMYWTSGYWGQWLDLPASGELYRAATAMALAAVVTTQIGNLFAHRTERISAFKISWFNNRLIWIGIASELFFITLIVYVPFLHGLIGTASFSVENWLFLFAWTPALLVLDEIRKALLNWRAQHTIQVTER
ncbi:MAG: cation-transporting P-type ATPase [Anaerolineaceae bacterium]|nr:cation-transporting P-type ATPase [Anaerolineaceae bacterium]MCB9098876.1 cation-transporting P-type ATPase [Anaerolineales bacterium]